MRKLAATLLLSGLACAGAANAAPVARTADLTLTISILGLPPITLSATGATVMVDGSGGLGGAGQITIPAGSITLPAPITIPVTATTAVDALTAQTIHNQRGVFSIGGAGTNIPTTELPCPPTTAPIACVQQTGLGGVMGLSGSIGVVVIPGSLTIPVALDSARIGQGGFNSIPGALRFDAAPWTANTGSLAIYTPGTVMTPTTITYTQMGTGSVSGSRFTLVSPTYVVGLGSELPIFSSLEVRLVPEPTAAALLGAVLAALALAARRHR